MSAPLLGDAGRAADLRERARALPRIDLGVEPTPLQELPRLSAELGGPRILVKRDDLAGGPLGGNKTRMLEWVLAKAIADGADCVVGGSAVQSNYSRQLAAACARTGVECHLVLRRVRGERDARVEGSLLLDLLYGAAVTFVEDDREAQIGAQLALAEALSREGRRVYLAPTASDADKALHAVAYADAATELLEQCRQAGVAPSAVVVSTLDTTHAGLLLGLRASGSSAALLAISPNERSIFPDRTIEQEVADLAERAGRIVGLARQVDPGEVDTRTDWVGPAYGAVTPEATSAIRRFASTEALALDPVYTGKAAAALVDLVAAGTWASSEAVVFWHTGGLPGLFAYSDLLGLEASSSLEPRRPLGERAVAGEARL
jgi:1-aminocyclopropane-1-carboxylate deaminase/D-cysteine desulfhydrase-like pyridoxal-dependent ACC family enzyme